MPDSSLTVYLQKGSMDEDLRGFALYQSGKENFNPDSNTVFEFIPYQPEAKFSLKTFTAQRGVYYFVTAISRTNNESRPVMISGAVLSVLYFNRFYLYANR
jgi:hypothetical protein